MNCNFGDKTKAYKEGIKFIVDEDDYDVWVEPYSFKLDKGYVRFSSRGEHGLCNKRLHRFIMDVPDHMFVDHINGNKLDNRKANLRVCTNQQNCMNRGKTKNNTSGYKGVNWHKQHNKWEAQIRVDGKKKFLGYFEDKEQAHQAYCKACHEHHGEFANSG